jgi:hypothetical protein
VNQEIYFARKTWVPGGGGGGDVVLCYPDEQREITNTTFLAGYDPLLTIYAHLRVHQQPAVAADGHK